VYFTSLRITSLLCCKILPRMHHTNGIILVFIDTGMKKQDKNTPTLPIGKVAERLDVSVETIRLYERRGLILVTKTRGNQRLFSESDIERLRCIRTAINEHKISIEGIRRIQSLSMLGTYSMLDGSACKMPGPSSLGCRMLDLQRQKERVCRTRLS